MTYWLQGHNLQCVHLCWDNCLPYPFNCTPLASTIKVYFYLYIGLKVHYWQMLNYNIEELIESLKYHLGSNCIKCASISSLILEIIKLFFKSPWSMAQKQLHQGRSFLLKCSSATFSLFYHIGAWQLAAIKLVPSELPL